MSVPGRRSAITKQFGKISGKRSPAESYDRRKSVWELAGCHRGADVLINRAGGVCGVFRAENSATDSDYFVYPGERRFNLKLPSKRDKQILWRK